MPRPQSAVLSTPRQLEPEPELQRSFAGIKKSLRPICPNWAADSTLDRHGTEAVTSGMCTIPPRRWRGPSRGGQQGDPGVPAAARCAGSSGGTSPAQTPQLSVRHHLTGRNTARHLDHLLEETAVKGPRIPSRRRFRCRAEAPFFGSCPLGTRPRGSEPRHTSKLALRRVVSPTGLRCARASQAVEVSIQAPGSRARQPRSKTRCDGTVAG